MDEGDKGLATVGDRDFLFDDANSSRAEHSSVISCEPICRVACLEPQGILLRSFRMPSERKERFELGKLVSEKVLCKLLRAAQTCLNTSQGKSM